MSTSLVSLASLLDSFEPMTPQVRVAAIISHEQRLLVVEHRKRGQRYWVLPGGRLEPGETLRLALQRELKEELALEGQVGQLLAVYETLAPDRHTVNLAFGVDIGRRQPQLDANDPVLAGWRWVEMPVLGQIDFRPPIAAALAEIIAEGLHGPVRVLGDTWTAAER